jgi:hypothetical protein
MVLGEISKSTNDCFVNSQSGSDGNPDCATLEKCIAPSSTGLCENLISIEADKFATAKASGQFSEYCTKADNDKLKACEKSIHTDTVGTSLKIKCDAW